jgi:translation initiation factor IF-2
MPVIITPRDDSPVDGAQATAGGLAQEVEQQQPPTASGESADEVIASESGEVASSTVADSAAAQIPAPADSIPDGPDSTKEVAGPDDPSPEEPTADDHRLDPASDGPRAPGPLARVMRRDDYIGPGSTSGRPPTLEESAPSGARRTKPDANAPRARPAIKLAPMPNAEPPKSVKAPEEPAAQKPDMKLPADALRASRSGIKPLAAHLRRHEQNLDEAKRRDGGTEERSDRRGKAAKAPPATDSKTPMLGGREQRQLKRQRQGQRRGGGRFANRSMRRTRRSGISTAAPRKEKVSLQLPCTVRELSEAAGVPAAQILRILMQEGVMTTITAVMDEDLTELVAEELSLELEFKTAVSFEDQVLEEILNREDPPEDLTPRPPVITFLGHVDHGKTSLLDKIIDIDVVSGESGGITQHIRAYTVNKEGKQISFVDTPGHEAFTEMRARGADVTDIAVLVVAADDGVMPQTEEAISHARAAEVPIVVALNKSDLPGVDINRAMQGLSTNEMLPSEWGGDVEVIKTSAITGDGIDELLETLLTVAELHEYKANANRDALGTCLEAQQETGRGVVAKVIVQNGTLKVGDIIVCGQAHGRVKAMYDTLDTEKRVQVAGPSVPVNLTGLDVAPGAGDHFYVLDDIAQARSIAEARAEAWREVSLGDAVPHVTLENLFDRLEAASDIQILNIILRADVRGSIEAIRKELGKLDHPEVKIKILQATVGGITEADVTLADASDAIILGFNVVPEEGARSLAEQRGVQIRRYEVIYKVTEDLKAALEGLLKPEEHEVDLGRALVQLIFKISRIGTVAGCRVLAGKIERNARARIIRDNTIIGDYPIDTLRRDKDDAKEVREGLECGIKMAGFNDVKEGDLLEVYRIEEKSRSFDD